MEQETAPFSFFQKQRSEKHRKEGKTGVMFDIQEELKKQAVQLYVKLEQNLQEMKLEMARVEYPSYKKDGGVWPEEVQLEKCTEENELIKQWKVIAGQDIPDRERISVILKKIIDQGNRWEKVCKKESSRAQMVLEDKNRLLKEAELLNQLFDSYERVLSRLEEKMPEKDPSCAVKSGTLD